MEHGGTSLLSRMIGAHPDAISVGGVLKNLPRLLRGRKLCSCGGSDASCEFWSGVLQDLTDQDFSRERLLVVLQRGDYADPLIGELFHTIARRSQHSILVESSRRPWHARGLNGHPGIQVVPIHIFKDPRAQMGSAKRRGEPLWRETVKYWRISLSVASHARQHPAGIGVPYEAYCLEPERWLRHIMLRLGRPFQPVQLSDWGRAERHMLGGNDMKALGSSTVIVDSRWNQTLKPHEQQLVRTLAAVPYAVNLRGQMKLDTVAP
jgi:hypothetical protein